MWIWPALIVSILLGALGQILMKVAMKTVGPVPFDRTPYEIGIYFFSAVFSLPMFGAVFCYGLSFFMWLAILSRADLSLARPLTSLGYLITLAYGFYAGEEMTPGRIFGTVLIVSGLFFVTRSGLKI